jgi:hypothetical protein
MSAFVASGATAPGQITTHPFWPSVDLDEIRKALRIDSSVTLARLERAVVAAAIAVNRELKDWRLTQQAAGHTTLQAVPAEQVKDTSEYVHLYQRALFSAVGAEICERYRSYDATRSGQQQAEDLTTIDEYRRDQRWAIRDFLGQSRSTVELI